MFGILSEYFRLQKYQLNWFWLLIIYVLAPGIALLIFLAYSSDPVKDFARIFKNSGSDVITVLSVVNGFLLSGIAIVLTGSKLSEKRLMEAGKMYKIDAKPYFEKLKEIMLYDVLVQFVLVVFISVLVIAGKYLEESSLNWYVSVPSFILFVLSVELLVFLVVKFLKYQKAIAFGRE